MAKAELRTAAKIYGICLMAVSPFVFTLLVTVWLHKYTYADFKLYYMQFFCNQIASLPAPAVQQDHQGCEQPRHQADETVVMRKIAKAGAILLADPVAV